MHVLTGVKMKVVSVLFLVALILLGLAGCGDSTGPEEVYRSQISVISTSTSSVIADYDLDDVECEGLVMSPDGSSLYIWGYYDCVAQLSSSTGSITGYMDCYGYNPCDLALNESGTELYVLSHNDLHIVNTASMKEIGTIELGLGISWAMEMRPGTDLLYLQRDYEGGDGTFVVDLSQGETTDTLSLSSERMAFSHDGDMLYMAQGSELIKVDPESGQQLAEVTLPRMVINMCVAEGFGMIYATWHGDFASPDGGVSEINPNSFLIERGIAQPGYACHVCCVESLDLLYVSGTEDHKIMVMDLDTFQPAGEIDVEQYVRGLIKSPGDDFVYCPVFNDEESAG